MKAKKFFSNDKKESGNDKSLNDNKIALYLLLKEEATEIEYLSTNGKKGNKKVVSFSNK